MDSRPRRFNDDKKGHSVLTISPSPIARLLFLLNFSAAIAELMGVRALLFIADPFRSLRQPAEHIAVLWPLAGTACLHCGSGSSLMPLPGPRGRRARAMAHGPWGDLLGPRG